MGNSFVYNVLTCQLYFAPLVGHDNCHKTVQWLDYGLGDRDRLPAVQGSSLRQNILTGYGANPASYPMVTMVFC